MLQGIDTLAVGIAARDGLVDHIPGLHLSVASVHHTADPLLHSPCKGVFLLLVGEGDRVEFHHLAHSQRVEIKGSIGSLWLQNHVVVLAGAAGESREGELIGLAACLHGDSSSKVLRIAAPSVLHGELNARGSLVRSHVNIEYIVTLVELVVAARHYEELAPVACGHKVQGTVLDGRSGTHGVVGERSVGFSLVGVEVHLLLNLNSGRLELVELYLLHVEGCIGRLRLQDYIVVGTGRGGDTGQLQFVDLVASLDGHSQGDVLSIVTPSVLDGQLNTGSLLVGSHIEADEVVTLSERIVATGQDEELAPVACGHEVEGTVDDGRFTTHGIVGEGTVGLVLVRIRRDEGLDEGIWVDVEFLVFQQAVEPLHGLLGVPGQCVAINRESGLGGHAHIVGDRREVHLTLFVDARGHLHGIAGHGLVEV